MRPLSRRFFQRDALCVARELLGRVLVHEGEGTRVAGRIVETEAYAGPGDRAAHVAGGRRTARTEVFWQAGGVAYVYLVYGMHHCFNVVTGPPDEPSAVLVRAVSPLEGLDVMAHRRGVSLGPGGGRRDGRTGDRRKRVALTSGPGRLAAAYGFTRAHTGLDVTRPPIYVARGRRVPDDQVVRAPRVGVDYAGEDALLEYRFFVRGDPFVSRPWPPRQKQAVEEARAAAKR